MNEREFRNTIKTAVKSPSTDFTNNVMTEISSGQNELRITYKRKFRLLLIACWIIIISSIFIRIPEIEFLSYIFESSPVIFPILSLIFLIIAFQQLYDLKSILIEPCNNSVVQH